MKQFYGQSKKGELKEALVGLSDPKLIILMSNPEQFAEHVSQLQELYPDVPSIGCIGMSYPMCRKTPCFSYGYIRHVHRIYASN